MRQQKGISKGATNSRKQLTHSNITGTARRSITDGRLPVFCNRLTYRLGPLMNRAPATDKIKSSHYPEMTI